MIVVYYGFMMMIIANGMKDDDDDTLASKFEDYIASVYNKWRTETETENLQNRFWF